MSFFRVMFVGLGQDCVLSPWLFNAYMDGVVREVNVGLLGMLSANGGRFEINQLLFCRWLQH